MLTTAAHVRTIPVVMFMAVWLTCVPAASLAEDPILIRMPTAMPENSAWAIILKEMAAQWTKVSNGRVQVRLYFGGSRGDDPTVVGDMRTRALNAAVLSSVGLAELDRTVYAMSIPMAYDSYDEAYAVLEKMRPRLEATLDAKGFVVLNWADAGWVHFFTKSPVATPDDLKKLKLFQWQGDPKSMAIWQAAGFNPVAGALSELLSGLKKKGGWEACSAPPQFAVLFRYHEAAPYMTDLNWALLFGAMVVRKDTWNQIPADIRPALLKAAQEAGIKLRDDIRRSGESSVVSMKKGGLTVVSVNAAARQEWIKAAQAASPSVRGDFVPADAYDEAIKCRDEYRKQHQAPQQAPAGQKK